MELFGQLAAVGFVLGLLVVSLRWLGRRGRTVPLSWRRAPRDPGARLEAIDRLTLTPQHSLHVVRFAGRLLLVSCQPGGTSVMAETPARAAELGQGA